MSSSGDKSASSERLGALAAAIREVKNAAADRDDVVIEMREAERMRLELFATELLPTIAEIPQDIVLFDFAISSGLQPRFWIDAISHVSMGRDKRTFRFVRDTRLGRVVMAESTDMKTVAESVTRYIAERMVERQRLQEGDVVPVRREVVPSAEATPSSAIANADTTSLAVDAADADAAATAGWKPFLSGLGVVLFGAIAAAAVTASYYWDRLDFSRLGLDRLGF